MIIPLYVCLLLLWVSNFSSFLLHRYKRDFELKKAVYDTEVEMARAEAEMATKLQESIVKQKIKEENMKVDIVERSKLIEVAEQEVSRRACELDAKVRKPAEGQLFYSENLFIVTYVRACLVFNSISIMGIPWKSGY